jgi:hypothetical protein
MISDELVKESTKLEKYLIKEGRKDLVIELRRLGPEELKQRLLKQTLYKQEILDSREANETLKKLKESVKLENAPYAENLRMTDKIARFINLLLKENE